MSGWEVECGKEDGYRDTAFFHFLLLCQFLGYVDKYTGQNLNSRTGVK